MIEPRSRSVLDAPHARGMTVVVGAAKCVNAAAPKCVTAAAPVRRLFLLLLLAADGLQLREHRVDVEVLALFFGRLEFRLLAGGFGRRQQGCAAIGGVDRLFLG